MDHLVVTAELRVLVLQGVEAVRALRDDLAHTHPVEHLHVGHDQHLEQVLVAAAPRRIARAHLAGPEDDDVDPRPLEELGHGLGDLAVLVVERTGATDPVEVLGGDRLARIYDGHTVEGFGPAPGSPWVMPHGLPWFSIDRYALPSSAGKLLSINDRYRRMSRILSRISMLTGHISSHALQLVHAHISSGVIRSNNEFEEIVISRSTPSGGL